VANQQAPHKPPRIGDGDQDTVANPHDYSGCGLRICFPFHCPMRRYAKNSDRVSSSGAERLVVCLCPVRIQPLHALAADLPSRGSLRADRNEGH
jgi:hypothetical protein